MGRGVGAKSLGGEGEMIVVVLCCAKRGGGCTVSSSGVIQVGFKVSVPKLMLLLHVCIHSSISSNNSAPPGCVRVCVCAPLSACLQQLSLAQAALSHQPSIAVTSDANLWAYCHPRSRWCNILQCLLWLMR